MLHYNKPRYAYGPRGRYVFCPDTPEIVNEIAVRKTDTEYICAVVYEDGLVDVVYERRLISESPRTVEVIQHHNTDKYGRYYTSRVVCTGPDVVLYR